MFDYDQFGDSPVCLHKKSFDSLANLKAQAFGVGKTENDNAGTLLETTVVTLSNEECQKWIRYNETNDAIFKSNIKRHLPSGMTDEILCTRGIYNEEKQVFSVSKYIVVPIWSFETSL